MKSQSALDEKAEMSSILTGGKPVIGERQLTSASNTRADNPPAPPPCEACKGIPDPGAMLNFDALDLVVAHHAHLAAKDAEIAELRALVLNASDLQELQEEVAAKAALAPKEGR